MSRNPGPLAVPRALSRTTGHVLLALLGTGIPAAAQAPAPIPPAIVPSPALVPPAVVGPASKVLVEAPAPRPPEASSPVPSSPASLPAVPSPSVPPSAVPLPPAAVASPPAPPAVVAPAAAAAPLALRREPPPLTVARVSADPVPTLAPSTFVDTMRAAEAYRVAAEAGGWPTVPGTSKFGERGPVVAALRARLGASGDLAPELVAGEAFDAPLLAAAKRFQGRHGLPETGLVGGRTLDALNVPAVTRHRQLAASAARLIGSGFPFGERYVVVNIPSATVEAVAGGRVERRYVAVVGRPDRATPSVETRITSVNLNPTWTVPVSLIKKDIIPHVRKDPAYLAKMGIRVLDATGAEIDPGLIDWSTDRAAAFTLRQDPGTKNSLGQVRIDMPNRHAVYLHDTPQKRLFGGDVRFHSSGCVRVSDVKSLVAWLLQGTPGPSGAGSAWGPIEIETGIAAGERRDVRLAKPVPVAFVYLTGYATPDGRAHFRDDVYGLDVPAPAVQTGPPATRVAPTGADLATTGLPPPPRRTL